MNHSLFSSFHFPHNLSKTAAYISQYKKLQILDARFKKMGPKKRGVGH